MGAHPPALVVCHSLLQLTVGVHHEGSARSDGLVERLPSQDHECAIFCTHVLKTEGCAIVGENGRLRHAHMPLVCSIAHLERALANEQHGAVARGHHQLRRRAGFQTHIPHIDRGECARRALGGFVLASDNAHLTSAVRKWDHHNAILQNGLVAGFRHLVLSGKVHPIKLREEQKRRLVKSSAQHSSARTAARVDHHSWIISKVPPFFANSVEWNSSWMIPEAAVIHCTSPAPITSRLPSESPCSTSPCSAIVTVSKPR
mmetsp:Transcript_29696/g.65817  ORF Transcript_29696/g.65817 Transcript_29696/m.65817 type:complete len:259 (-) Transcript_29696:259-1035(-)